MNTLDLAWIRQRLDDHTPEPIPKEKVPRRAAVATVLRVDQAGGSCEILFILRAKHEGDPWSGHMAFPGGRMEQEDGDELATARRETQEEVALDLARNGELLGRVDDIHASASGRVLPLAIRPFVFLLTEPDAELRPDLAEVEEIHWVPAATLLDPANAATVPYELNGQHFDLPAFRVAGDRIIWGLTYQMLMRLFTVLGWEVGQ
jgi:8-oxo-dGTP pyrophosphatase MutT (NUDIX family)